jgi:hypothetical protein
MLLDDIRRNATYGYKGLPPVVASPPAYVRHCDGEEPELRCMLRRAHEASHVILAHIHGITIERVSAKRDDAQAVLRVPGSVDAAVGYIAYDRETREIDAVLSTGSRVRRSDWDGEFDEVLEMTPKAIRMRRLNSGAPVLDAHNWYAGVGAMLGSIVPGSARLDSGALTARIKFSRGSALAQRVVQDLQDGIQIPLSVGYKVHASRDDRTTSPITRTATDWEPIEVSLVPVAAEESGTGFRSFKAVA